MGPRNDDLGLDLSTLDAVIFDMGSVLIGWDVRPPYREHFASEEELETFLRGPFREIYDAVHDGDGTIAECLAPVRTRYPESEHLIDLYQNRWADFVTGVMHDTVQVARDLSSSGVTLFGLTNWPRQVWPPQTLLPEQSGEFEFLDLFEDIWVSGHHKLRKPDPASYHSALSRFERSPESCVFIDDLLVNVTAASQIGLEAILFEGADPLRRRLEQLELLQGKPQ